MMIRDFELEKRVQNDNFYSKMIDYLEEVWPNHSWVGITEDGQEYCKPCGVISTSGWHKAMRLACEDLGYNFFVEYWDKLEWYDSDYLDDDLGKHLIEYFDKYIKTEETI